MAQNRLHGVTPTCWHCVVRTLSWTLLCGYRGMLGLLGVLSVSVPHRWVVNLALHVPGHRSSLADPYRGACACLGVEVSTVALLARRAA